MPGDGKANFVITASLLLQVRYFHDRVDLFADTANISEVKIAIRLTRRSDTHK